MDVKVFGLEQSVWMSVDVWCTVFAREIQILDGWDFGLSWKAGFWGVRPGKCESEFF